MADAKVQPDDTSPREQESSGEVGGREDSSVAPGHNGNSGHTTIDESPYDGGGVYVDEKPAMASLPPSGGYAGNGGMGDGGSPDRRPASSYSRRKDGTHSKKKKKKGVGAGGHEGNPALSVEDLFVTISTVQVRAHVVILPPAHKSVPSLWVFLITLTNLRFIRNQAYRSKKPTPLSTHSLFSEKIANCAKTAKSAENDWKLWLFGVSLNETSDE